jgi:hypothetical protein
MKLNQRGIAHIQFILLAVLVVGVVGFASFRVGQMNKNKQQNNQDQTHSNEEISELKATEEKETEEVNIPSEKQEAAPISTPTETKTATKPTPEQPKKEKIQIGISLVSVNQQGATLNVHSKLDTPASGTCNYKLYKEGFDKVRASNKISNSQDCIGQLNLSGMPNYDGWSIYVWFEGDDGITQAWQDAKPVSLTTP